MELTPRERDLIAAVQDGLPLEPRPYAAVGRMVGLSEAEVIDGLRQLTERGVIRRFGLVLSHRNLGYRANGMVVWDVPDDEIGVVGESLAALPFVTLCYRRPRRLPDWPYNLFCMIHGALQLVLHDSRSRPQDGGSPRREGGAGRGRRRSFACRALQHPAVQAAGRSLRELRARRKMTAWTPATANLSMHCTAGFR